MAGNCPPWHPRSRGLPTVTASRFVRLVIPVHDEGSRLTSFLEELVALAPASDAPPTELVVVDDGSRPEEAHQHAAAVAEASRRLAQAGSRHRATLVGAPTNQGKGAAVVLGWGDGGGGAWLGFVDGDGAVPAREVWRLAAMLRGADGCDALLGARVRGTGREVSRTPLRALQGRVFAGIAGAVLELGVRDPQCGLKFFRATALRPHLTALRERTWLLDAELLARLGRAGARLREVPIDWFESGGSKLRLLRDPALMLLGLVRLRLRLGTQAAGPSR